VKIDKEQIGLFFFFLAADGALEQSNFKTRNVQAKRNRSKKRKKKNSNERLFSPVLNIHHFLNLLFINQIFCHQDKL